MIHTVLICLCLWRLVGVFGVNGVWPVSVKQGDSVTLNLTEMQDDDQIQWKFGYRITLIAKIDKQTNRITVYDDVLDGRFRDRLKLDNQTGSLTITNITTEHAGYYKVLTNSARKSFDLTVCVVKEISVKKGDFVTLHNDLTEMKNDDRIHWSFEYGPVFAEINKWANSFTVYDDVLDGRFRDRLKLDNQTGSLTITDITTEHDGDYKLLINNVEKFFILLVFDELTSVIEGDSVTLDSGLTEIQTDDLITWTFETERSLMAKITSARATKRILDDPDGEFEDRLEVDHQTGSLTITNIRTTDSGLYELTINNSISETKYRFSVTVYAHLPVPVISRDCSSSSSSSSCSLVCSAVNMSHVTLSWYKGNSVLYSISAYHLSISLFLRLEVEYQDKNIYGCVISNPINNYGKYLNIRDLCQPCPDPQTPLHPTSYITALPPSRPPVSASLKMVLISAAAAGSLLIVAVIGTFCIWRKHRGAGQENLQLSGI